MRDRNPVGKSSLTVNLLDGQSRKINDRISEEFEVLKTPITKV
jgi:hypothetical protein